MGARISQTAAHEALREIFDPEGRWWCTLHGILLLTGLAQLAAGVPVKAWPEQALKVTGDELRFWLAVHADLVRRFERAAPPVKIPT